MTPHERCRYAAIKRRANVYRVSMNFPEWNQREWARFMFRANLWETGMPDAVLKGMVRMMSTEVLADRLNVRD